MGLGNVQIRRNKYVQADPDGKKHCFRHRDCDGLCGLRERIAKASFNRKRRERVMFLISKPFLDEDEAEFFRGAEASRIYHREHEKRMRKLAARK